MKYFWIVICCLIPIYVFAQLPSGVTLDTSDWIPFELSSYEKMDGTALDMSWLLETPAGEHGFLSVDGGHFVFEDGTRARFWGGNIFGEANFPEKDNAERMADIIARSGANIIRMHHLDVVAPWTDKVVKRSFFGGQQPHTTRKLDKEMLDKFDYMVKCFKDRGIYIFLSHISSRFVRPGDEFPGDEHGFNDVGQGFKVEGMFDPYLIELQQEYLKALLTHVNPYTGTALIDEPALVLTEIINENSLFWLQQEGSFAIESGYYRNMIGRMFRDWLLEKYGDADSVKTAWTQKDKITLFDDENISKGELKLPSVYMSEDEWPVSEQRRLDTHQFLYHLQDDYYQQMHDFLRKIGLKIPIAGSNHWTSDVADLHVNAKLDYIDRHSYWTHPRGEYNYIAGQGVQAEPMVKDPQGGNIGTNARRRIFGKPFTLSEWHNPLPNPYRAEGMPIIAAYSSLQGWHPMHYAYWGAREAEPDTINSFEGMFDPTQMNLIPICALMFHRQDFKEADQGYFDVVSKAQTMDPDRHPDRHPSAAMVGKYGLAFLDQQPVPACNNVEVLQSAVQADGEFTTTTGQLDWDTNTGVVKLNSERTQGVIGFIGDKKIETKDFIFEMKTDFAVIVISSLTDTDLSESDRILVSTSADARFTDIGMAEDFSEVLKTGHFPFLMQPVEGKIRYKPSDSVTVYKLSEGGQRLSTLDVDLTGGGTILPLMSENRAMHYEIVRE